METATFRLEDGRDLVMPKGAHEAIRLSLIPFFGPDVSKPMRAILSKLADAGYGFSVLDTD